MINFAIIIYVIHVLEDDWTTPAPNPLQPGDSCLMKPTFYFYNGGDVLIRYYILDLSDNPIDSVDVNIINTVSVKELNQTHFNYNPVNNYLNINFPTPLVILLM